MTYLKKAPIYLFLPGTVDDLMDTGNIIGSTSLRTDGVWVWPDYVAGYYEKYNIFLPHSFITNIQNRNYVFPNPNDIDIKQIMLKILQTLPLEQ